MSAIEEFDCCFTTTNILTLVTTSYESVAATFKYLADIPPQPGLSIIKLTYPSTHASILAQFRSHLHSIARREGQKIIAVIDGIVSTPGQLMPWEGMVAICKEENVWSIVDAAHCIGQIAFNLKKSQPDFWVSVSLSFYNSR